MRTLTAPTLVPLTRDLKLRLLRSLQAGQLDILDYSELRQAGSKAIELDLEQLTPEELSIAMEAVRILDRFQ
ncbi:hypothetical protein [Spirosoma jeollabukense]